MIADCPVLLHHKSYVGVTLSTAKTVIMPGLRQSHCLCKAVASEIQTVKLGQVMHSASRQDNQLTYRHWLQLLIQDIQMSVSHGTPYGACGHPVEVSSIAAPAADPDGRLSWAIDVVDACVW